MIFRLPDLGEGLTEAEVVQWLVAEGDTVAVDQVVAEVETAKSVVEVPTPFAGRVATLHAAAGSTLAVGEPLITVEEVATATETYREEERAGSGNVLIGYGTSGAATTTTRRRRPRGPILTNSGHTRPPQVISPLVRNLARTTGVELGTVQGTGRGGVITRADVERAAARPAVAPAAAVPAAAEGVKRVPLNGFRKAVTAALTRSRAEIPEATVWVDVDATELWRLRESNPGGPGLLAYLARFTVAALREFPVLNARFDAERQEIVQYDRIDLGIAVQGERGLVVPAVAGAETMTTARLGDEIRRITADARTGRVSGPDGTFTLNNYGSLGVDGSAAIINHPQVAILGFGRMIDRAWVVDGELCVRKITQMSFVFDHRVCDGGTAAGFMRSVADAIENPASVIARL
ncbi:branched-chain alpha-keto acid dehydrogenase subunit E2 [Actinoplanes sp. SE50]|uniref:dihydrolipoamide acetyltransferase family protein n=1 Tax=unclassified Actinoplanes TaxID=2626549 RepID=UPI00023EBF5F|nr:MULTISPECIES: dihydrolipoamide acetyltransferase family protein [unclassified Actinoplanes]AEV85756.1 pyruvate dehydrogenase E2 component (dihydrolipoamide acetyltransferase) [Actinoplanes sp. SE50/110]ATO84149.1 branched-chain alpha-keto acid dehydrogenase subunit E2 [Actinoplanes sp. SE50]SLM01559.1 branched-chain alpha-keto acid dehydrogenase subunit E2 [Actinoplanes sp. SE50/110]